MSRPLGLLVQPGLDPGSSVATDLAVLATVLAPGGDAAGVLRVFDCPGALVSLGRYHTVPPARGASVRLCRRLTGGRAVPAGAGFVGVALALPHRAALIASTPLALRPEQVMNRYVRGILEGCKLGGVAAFYPGRDVVTVDRRVLGLVSFEVDEGGALLVEAILARSRDFACLAQRLDAVDPDGIVSAAMLDPDDTTSLAHELGREPALEEVADWLVRGYEQTLAVTCERVEVQPDDAFDEQQWLVARTVRVDLDHRARTPTQLGVLEAHLALAAGRIREARLAGDFIADSPAVVRLEAALKGCPATAAAVAAVVDEVFANPRHFILGVGPVRTVADTIARALPT